MTAFATEETTRRRMTMDSATPIHAGRFGTWTSMRVMTASSTRTRTYGRFSSCATRISSFAVEVATPPPNQIQEREQEDPHDIDEVPVQAHDLDRLRPRRPRPTPPRLHIEEQEAEDAARHVGAVEPRLRVERGAERPELGPNQVRPRRESLLEEAGVLVDLNRNEGRPQDERGGEERPHARRLVVDRPVDRLRHREAARDQDERVHCRERDVQGKVRRGRVRPEVCIRPEGEPGRDQAREEEDLGDDEDPDPELTRGDLAPERVFVENPREGERQ